MRRHQGDQARALAIDIAALPEDAEVALLSAGRGVFSHVFKVWSADRSVVVQDGDELIDILKAGQGVLNILPLSGVKDEVDSAIVELHPVEVAESPRNDPRRPFRPTTAINN